MGSSFVPLFIAQFSLPLYLGFVRFLVTRQKQNTTLAWYYGFIEKKIKKKKIQKKIQGIYTDIRNNYMKGFIKVIDNLFLEKAPIVAWEIPLRNFKEILPGIKDISWDIFWYPSID